MGLRFTCLLAALAACVMPTSNCLAQTPESTAFRRWGVGWDDGIGVRYRLDSSWALGLSVNGRLDGTIRKVDELVDTTQRRISNNRAGGSLKTRLTLIRDTRLNKWMGLGLFGGVAFNHYSDHEPGYDRIDNGYSVDAGIRVTFSFFRRLVLESRFGLTASRNHSNSRSHNSGYGVWRSHSTEDTWYTSSFGNGLGPGSVLQFMVYF